MSDHGNTDRTDRHTEISRRRALAAAGAFGLTTTIAGCMGGDGGGSDEITNSSDEQQAETTNDDGINDSDTTAGGGTITGTAVESIYDVTGKSEGVPTELQYNFYNDQQTVPKTFVWDRMAETTYGADDGLFYPAIAKNWTYDTENQTFTINLREDTTWWHNGEQVTSQDVWAVLMLEWHDRQVLSEQTESIETPDDKTVVLNLSNETNPTLLEQQILTRTVLPYTHYGDWAEDLKDLLGKNDEEKWNEYLTNNVVTETFSEKIGNGPFKVTGTTRQAFETAVHEGHWAMDSWANAGVEGSQVYWGDKNRWIQAAYSDKIDTIGQADQKQLPDHFVQYMIPATNGLGLGLNHNIKPLHKIKVRQALMYVINREAAAKAASSSTGEKIVPEAITGISASQDTYIPEGDIRSQYQTYPVDTGKATTLLKEAGLSKQGGSWRLEDGSKWSPKITVMANSTSKIQAMNTIVDQLSQFGINAKLSTVPNSQFYGELWTENDFTMYAMTWGGWRAYPVNGLIASLYKHRHDNIGYPALRKNGGKIKVSMPIGKPNGNKKMVNVEELFSKLTSSADKQRNLEILQKLAWVYNQTLPELPLFHGKDTTWMATDAWDIPKPDSPGGKMNMPEYALVKTGLMTPKTK